jgi:CubicO group peptidase (beta-lactamase class C family)
MTMGLEQAFREAVTRFEQAVGADGDPLKMKSLVVSSNGETLGHLFAGDVAYNVRSICKVVVALTVGIAVADGVRLGSEPLSLDTDVGALLKQAPALRDLEGVDAWSGVKVAHLLSHTTGHDRGFLFRADIGGLDPDALLPYALSRPLDHEPGVHFAYSNVGYYLISALFQELLGRPFGDVAGELLLSKLGITGATWRKRGKYTAGATGLELRPADLHKLAELVAGDGHYRGRRIAPQAWCESMRSVFIRIPELYDPDDVLPKYGYGYGLWICGDGRYFCWGTDGQYLIVVPDRDLVITTLADQPDMEPITSCLLPLLRPA